MDMWNICRPAGFLESEGGGLKFFESETDK